MMCGLWNISGTLKTSETEAYLCSDICTNQSILEGGQSFPILKRLSVSGENVEANFQNVLWLQCTRGEFRTIRFHLINGRGQRLSVEECDLTCEVVIFPTN